MEKIKIMQQIQASYYREESIQNIIISIEDNNIKQVIVLWWERVSDILERCKNKQLHYSYLHSNIGKLWEEILIFERKNLSR